MRAKQSGDTVTVWLSGEIDHCVVTTMRTQIESLIQDRSIRRLNLNFTDVSFMDSSGVGMIIGRYKTMAARGGSVSAEGLRPPMDRLFRLAGLHRIIDINSSERQENR